MRNMSYTRLFFYQIVFSISTVFYVQAQSLQPTHLRDVEEGFELAAEKKRFFCNNIAR